jgi:hypothetical protein
LASNKNPRPSPSGSLWGWSLSEALKPQGSLQRNNFVVLTSNHRPFLSFASTIPPIFSFLRGSLFFGALLVIVVDLLGLGADFQKRMIMLIPTCIIIILI